MKKTGLLLLLITALISGVAIAVLTSYSRIAVLGDDGYAVSSNATVKQSLTKGDGKLQSMEKVSRDDVVYSSALGYYVGDKKTPIDKDYPIYINDGNTLRFLDNNHWLVSTEVNLLQTYEGLYLNDGYTFNEDRSQADGDEFVLLALNNGLYMNAQRATFANHILEKEIPVNSILRFSESNIRWYYYRDGELVYDDEEAVYEAELTIGDNVYRYTDLLDALDLLPEVIEKKEKGKETEPLEEEIEEILNRKQEENIVESNLPEEEEGKQEIPETVVRVPEVDRTLEEEEIFYLGEMEDVDREKVKGTGSSDDDERVVKTKDIPATNREKAELTEPDDISDSDREKGSDYGGMDGDIPDTDQKPASGSKRSGSGGTGGGSGGSSKRKYEAPVISLSNYEPWMYAMKLRLNYTDTTASMVSAVTINAYQSLVFEGTDPSSVQIKTDSEGHKIYPRSAGYDAYAAVGSPIAGRVLSGTQDFALSPLEPGKTVYLQYSYVYYRDDGFTQTSSYVSDFIEVKTSDFNASELYAVKGTWTVPYAAYSNKISFENFTLENTSGYQKSDTFNFAEFKKDTLSYFKHITITLDRQNLVVAENPVTVIMNESYVEYAKRGSSTFVSNAQLRAGSEYKYRLIAMDDYGNILPFTIAADGQAAVDYTVFEGTVYTRKAAPEVTMRFTKTTKTGVEALIEVMDPELVILPTKNLKVKLMDKDGKAVKASGTIDGEIFTDVSEFELQVVQGQSYAQHKLVLNGLTPYTNYKLQITGTYDPNVNFAGLNPLPIATEVLLNQSFWTARDQKDYDAPIVSLTGLETKSATTAGGKIQITDPKASIPYGVVVSAYDSIRKREEAITTVPAAQADISGKSGTEKTYSWREYYGTHNLTKISSWKDGDVTLKSLLPDSKVYIQLSYNYYILDGSEQKTAVVYSDFIELNTPYEDYQLDTLVASWNTVFAFADKRISLSDMKFSVRKTGSNTGLNVLTQLLDHLTVTMEPMMASGTTVTATIGSDVIQAASTGSATFESGGILGMLSDSVYKYTVKAYRADGQEIPLVISADGQAEESAQTFNGRIYTRKTVPVARIKESLNAFGSVTLELYYVDNNEAIMQDKPILFSLTDDQGQKVELKGTLDGQAISAGTTTIQFEGSDTHVMKLTGLTVDKTYKASVIGSYDLQPTVKSMATEGRVPQVLNTELLLPEQRNIKIQRGSEPKVDFGEFEAWAYAVSGHITIDDPSAEITDDDVKVIVKDAEGKVLLTQSFAGSQEMILSPLQPGTTAYISYSYDYVDSKTGQKKTVTSDSWNVELLSLDEVTLEPLKGNWNTKFAVSDSQAGFDSLKFVNTSDYNPNPEQVTFANFKKNTLPYLHTMEVVFTPVGPGEQVKVTVTADLISRAKLADDEWVSRDILTRKGLLMSNTEYTYQVTGKDRYGNVIPLRMGENGSRAVDQSEFKGEIVTAKTAPTVRIEEICNGIGDMELRVVLTDKDGSLLPGTPLDFAIRDKDGRVKLNGELDGTAFTYGNTSLALSGKDSWEIKIDNLELGFHYTAEVYGSYDPQPDASPRIPGQDLSIVDYAFLRGYKFVATDGGIAIPGSGGGGGADPGKPGPGSFVAYIEPTVSMSKLNPWAYAIGTGMTVDDPTSAIQRGVTLTVYKNINGSGDYTLDSYGQKCYIGKNDAGQTVNSGASALLRKLITKTSDFAVSVLPPGTKVYVQYTYNYIEVYTEIYIDPVTRRKEVRTNKSEKKSYTSDLVEVQLLTVDEAFANNDFKEIGATWTEDFAAYPTSFNLLGMTYQNTGNYDPQPESFNWENFKQDTLTYLNNVRLTVTPDQGIGSTEITIGNATVQRAISTEGGITWKETTDSFKPDSIYHYTAKAYDRYGNVIPMKIRPTAADPYVSAATYVGDIYTRKDIPEVTVKEISNVSGTVKLRVTVNDKYASAHVEDPMVLTLTNSLTQVPAIMGGDVDGVEFSGLTELTLSGKTSYVITLNTLDFSASYTGTVRGTYYPQPTVAPAGKTIPAESDVLFTTFDFTTASLTSGIMAFSMNVPEATLTSDAAVITALMTKDTTQGLLGLVNRFTFTVTDPKSAVVAKVVLDKEALSAIAVEQGTKSYEVPNASDKATVTVTGTCRAEDTNLWEAILANRVAAGTNSSMTINISLPAGRLESMTQYTVSLLSQAVRPNATKDLNTKPETYKFYSNKKDPEFRYDEFFVSSNVFEITHVRVYDPDNTIASSGRATMYLYDMTNSNKLMLSQQIDVLSVDDPAIDAAVRSAVIVEDHDYNLVIIASSYNNKVTGGSYRAFTVFDTKFTAGGGLVGSMKLTSMDTDYKVNGKLPWINLSPEECQQRITDSIDGKRTGRDKWANKYTSQYFKLEYTDEGGNTVPIKAFTMEMEHPNASAQITVYYYYEDTKGNLQQVNQGYQQSYKWGTTFVVPTNSSSLPPATYVRFDISSSQSYGDIGLKMSGYSTAEYINASDSAVADYQTRFNGWYIRTKNGVPYQDSTTNGWSAVHMVPAKAGDTFVYRYYYDWEGNSSGYETLVFWYDSDKNLISYETISARQNYMITAPEKTAYVSYCAKYTLYKPGNTGSVHYFSGLYRITSASAQSKVTYAAEADVSVSDRFAYLKHTGQTDATIKVYSSQSVREPNWKEETSLKRNVTLTEDPVTGEWHYDGSQSFTGLKSATAYKLSLVINRLLEGGSFEEVVLKEITFQTDAPYELIHNRQEMRKIIRNPYGNFLVVEDFVNNINMSDVNVQGTLDFQGHTVTCTSDIYLINNIGQTGIVKNLVYEYPENTEATSRSNYPVVYTNYGKFDNFIVRLNGDFYKRARNYDTGFLVYYNYGTMSNFIMEMDGDLHLLRIEKSSYSVFNLFCYCNIGIIENWSMYGVNGARLVSGQADRDDVEFGYFTCGLIRYQQGTVRNGFTAFETDTYSTTSGAPSMFNFILDNLPDVVNNYYHSGDYWTLDRKDNRSFSAYERVINDTTAGTVKDVWHVTDQKYTGNANGIARVKYISTQTLYNATWQTEMLGEAFEVEENLKLEYYPRLNLNDCMKGAQAFVSLPSTKADMIPKFIDTEAYSMEDDRGTIRVRFTNPLNTQITSISIEKLTVLGIQSQGKDKDGVYNVFLNVKVDETKNPTDEYLSSYNMIEFEYKGGGVPVSLSGYKTSGFSFWKHVLTWDDWKKINEHKNWNYKLTDDIDFAEVPKAERAATIQIGLYKNSWAAFTGSLDGNGHTIRNITLEDVGRASVFYYTSGATIKNLTVDTMDIRGVRVPSESYAGFIGHATRTTLDNVHIRNASIQAINNVGPLVGYIESYSMATNCSSSDCTLTDLKSDRETYYGGLFGQTYSTSIQSCFARNVEIVAETCTNVQGIGGLIGLCHGSALEDVYATGSIKGTAYDIGGVMGHYKSGYYNRFHSMWSRVTIDVIGDYVGGIGGRVYGNGYGAFAVGDIYCTGDHVRRNASYLSDGSYRNTFTAYRGQKVTGLTANMKDDCKYLLSGSELSQWYNWYDKIMLGDNWNVDRYKDTAMEYFPKVYKYPAEYDKNGNRVLVDNQIDLTLPGSAGEQELIADKAAYRKEEGSAYGVYEVQATLTHPGMTHDEFAAYYETETSKVYGSVVSIDGMKTGESTVTKVTLVKGEGENVTRFLITIGQGYQSFPYDKALDSYRLYLKYQIAGVDYNMMADLAFTDDDGERKINYWEISNLDEWYNYVGEHGKNNENFMLTGMVDFAGGFGYKSGGSFTVKNFYNLQINRLEGKKLDGDGNPTCGIKNFVYKTDEEGDPWITNIALTLKDLYFREMTGDLSHENFVTGRSRNGVIFALRDIDNCIFEDITTKPSSVSVSSSAFIMIGYGDVTDVTIRDLYYDTSAISTTYNYCAGFMCWLQGKATNIKASSVYVNAPRASYVGGIFGMINASTQSSQSVYDECGVTGCRIYGGPVTVNGVVQESSVTGGYYVGYFASHMYGPMSDNRMGSADTAESSNHFTVHATGYGAGGFAYYLYTYVSSVGWKETNDNYVENGTVISDMTANTANNSTGGLIGQQTYVTYLRNNEAKNMKVSGHGYVGGLYGYQNYSYAYTNRVINCEISCSNTGGRAADVNGYGGISGVTVNPSHMYGCTVRNTKISGPRCVGGIVGNWSSNAGHGMYNCYVAEDVTITGTDPTTCHTGGLIGYGCYPIVGNCACGATITGAGENVGGVIGYLNQTNGYTPQFYSTYFSGKVSGRDWVGGIIGKNMNRVYYTVWQDNHNVDKWDRARFTYNGSRTTAQYYNRGYMNGIMVAGTITSMGEHVSAWFNNTVDPRYDENGDTPDVPTRDGDNPNVILFDQTVVNGVKVDTASKPFARMTYADARSFREPSIYQSADKGNMTTANFDFTFTGVMETYMPYVKYNSEILKYSNFKSYADDGTGLVQAGIKLPDYGTNPDAIQAYASGPDSLNIEVSTHEPAGSFVWPDDYQQVEYLQTSGNAWLTTGMAPSTNAVRYEFKWMEVGTLENGTSLFGSSKRDPWQWTGVAYHPTTGSLYSATGTTNGAARVNGLKKDTVYEGVIETTCTAGAVTGGSVKLTAQDQGGTQTLSAKTNYASTPANGVDIALFGNYDGTSGIKELSKYTRLYYWAMYVDSNDDGTAEDKVASFVPCYRKVDNVYGMYDLVNNRFCTNKGTGYFSIGPNVKNYPLENNLSGASGEESLQGAPAAQTAVQVSFDGGNSWKNYTTDDNGVITVSYDFAADVKVRLTAASEVTTFKAEELRRQISMTSYDPGDSTLHDVWYYATEADTDDDGVMESVVNYGTLLGSEPEYVIPSEYTEVEWIESNGAQCILTGIKGNTRSEMKVNWNSTARQLSGYGGGGTEYWGIRDGKYYELGYTTGGIKYHKTTEEPDEVIWDYWYGGQTTLTVNGVVAVNKSASTNITNTELKLFALGTNSWNSTGMRLWECKIYQNDELVRRFIPVVYKKGTADENPGLYDVVNGVFYQNATNSNKKKFTYGNPTSAPVGGVKTGTVTLPAGYKPVHLWSEVNGTETRTTVLASDGATSKLYALNEEVTGIATVDPQFAVSADAVRTVTSGKTGTDDPVYAVHPFLRQTVSVTDTTVTPAVTVEHQLDVYHNFTLDKVVGSSDPATKLNYRLYRKGDLSYAVSPWDDYLYDQVILDSRVVDLIDTDYTANLSKTGSLTTNFYWAQFQTSNLHEISNSFYVNGPLMAGYYNDGRFKVINYTTGKLLYSTKNNLSFTAYLQNAVEQLTSALTGTAQESGTSVKEGTGVPTTLGITSVKKPGLLTGTAVSSNLNLAAEEKEDGVDANGLGTGGDGVSTGNAVNTGESMLAEGNGKPEDEGMAAEGTATEGLLLANAVYVPGAGLTDLNGDLLVPEERTEYVEGKGLYIDGKLSYVDSMYEGNEAALGAVLTEMTKDGVESEGETETRIKTTEAGGKKGELKDNSEEISEEESEEETGETAQIEESGEEKEEKEAAQTSGEKKESTGGNTTGEKVSGTSDASGTHRSGENGTAVGGKKNTAAQERTAQTGETAGGTDVAAIMQQATGAPVLMVTPAARAEQTAQILGEETVMRDTVTGEKKKFDTASLASGRKLTVEKREEEEKASEIGKKQAAAADAKRLTTAAADRNNKRKEELPEEEILMEEAALTGLGAFVARNAFGQMLDSKEKSGFLMIGLMALLGSVALVTVYFSVVRKRRETQARIRAKKETAGGNSQPAEKETQDRQDK